MTTSPTPPAPPRSRPGRLYWWIADRLPASVRPGFTRFATGLRRARSRIRRMRRHILRTLVRRLVRSQSLDAPSSSWRSLTATWARRLLAVDLPGEGPVTLVDARSLTARKILTAVETRRDRFVIVTDDPDLMAVRQAGLLYEYVPGIGTPLAPDRGAQDRLVEGRRSSWVWGYGITATETLQP